MQTCKGKKKIKLSPSSSSVEFDFDKSLFSNLNSGDVETGNNEFNSRGWITHYTHETYLQNVSLNVNLEMAQLITDDPLSFIRIFLLQNVLKFEDKTVTLDKCFVSNQQKIVAFFVTSDNNAKFVIFWVPYNPAHVHELKYQITFGDNINLNLLDAPYTVFVY